MDNLGPIEHGEVELRPLTIFIGRNNTGKTYVAQALYACRQAARGVRPRPAEELSDDQRAALEAFARRRYGIPPNGGMAEQELPEVLHSFVADALRDGLEGAGREIFQRLKATFGVDDLMRITSWGNGEGLRLEIKGASAGGDEVCLFGSGGTTAPVGKMVRRLEIDWSEIDHMIAEPTLFDKEPDREELNYL